MKHLLITALLIGGAFTSGIKAETQVEQISSNLQSKAAGALQTFEGFLQEHKQEVHDKILEKLKDKETLEKIEKLLSDPEAIQKDLNELVKEAKGLQPKLSAAAEAIIAALQDFKSILADEIKLGIQDLDELAGTIQKEKSAKENAQNLQNKLINLFEEGNKKIDTYIEKIKNNWSPSEARVKALNEFAQAATQLSAKWEKFIIDRASAFGFEKEELKKLIEQNLQGII